jgi:hypothetical protein
MQRAHLHPLWRYPVRTEASLPVVLLLFGQSDPPRRGPVFEALVSRSRLTTGSRPETPRGSPIRLSPFLAKILSRDSRSPPPGKAANRNRRSMIGSRGGNVACSFAFFAQER